MSSPFTPEQEARLVELIREHCKPYDAALDVVMAVTELSRQATVSRSWRFGVTRSDRPVEDAGGDPK
ncbi:Transposase OS=Sphingobium scionense OX=1404341 GN=GGQ90_002891 PE=4 SV=1 [Sphingobium scionense]|jgi:hypothetical protein|uniref:Uncharacterized protein n=1 Tax=Sphingobium scionense TaxID=1404341 RepID=A0A7W6LS12_9SPHN|nr:hypothetical protein [Sphingobium scionense]